MEIQPKNKYAIGSWIKKVIESCKTLKQLDSAWRLKALFEQNNPIPQELISELETCYEEKISKDFER